MAQSECLVHVCAFCLKLALRQGRGGKKHILADKRFCCAAVFDGHSGFAAAQYLSEQLYDSFSDAIDEGSYGPECSIDGAASVYILACACFSWRHHAGWSASPVRDRPVSACAVHC